MRFSVPFVPLLAFMASAMAYSASSRSVFLNGNEMFTINEASDEVHRVSIESLKDVLALAVKIDGGARPHQLLFIFSDGNGLDHAVYPDYHVESQIASAKVPVAKLPESLISQDRVFVTVVAADSGEEENVAQIFVELIPTDDLRKTVSSEPVRLGAKPEIHHIFREEEATVNPIIPVAFSIVAVGLLLALLGGWSTTLSGSLLGAMDGGSYKTAFVAVIATFEYTFLRYYLGATIFTTLFHVTLLAVPGLLLGVKSLNVLAQLRAK